MNLESDYTKGSDKEKETPLKKKTNDEGMRKKMAGEELQNYLRYYDVYESQYEYQANPEKREKMVALYEYLKNVAYANSGQISLNIDEDKKKAVLVYQGPYLFITEAYGKMFPHTLWDTLRTCSLICMEPCDEGIKIIIKADVYDKIVKADRSKELEEIRRTQKRIEN